MFVPNNSSPGNFKKGIKDESIRKLVREAIGDPIHKPLVFTWAGRGRGDEAFPVAGDNLFSIFGRDVLDERGDYASFYTPLMKLFNANANEMMVQRLIPDDATCGYFRLCAEYLETTVDKPARNTDGSIQYDSNGVMKTDGTMAGLKIVFRTVAVTEDTYKKGKETESSSGLGTGAMLLPIYDIKGPYEGDVVNGFCHNLIPMSPEGDLTATAELSESIGARLYGLRFKETLPKVTTPQTWETLDGADYATFAFKEGAYDETSKRDYGFTDVVPLSWRNMSPTAGNLPEDGPFEEMYIYQDNLEKLLKLAQSKISDAPSDPYLVDVFGGLDVDGLPYDGLVVNPTDVTGATRLGINSNLFFSGGSDGTMDDDSYDELVRKEMTLFPNGTVKYANELKYTLGAFWDFGFSYDTKEAITNFIGNSRNTFIVLTPEVYNLDPLDVAGEVSARVTMSEMVQAMPESTEFGTPATRAAIMSGMGRIVDGKGNKKYPALYALADLVSKYMGAKDGYCKPAYRFGRGEDNIITTMVDITNTYKKAQVYSKEWDAGIIAIRNRNYYEFFIPAVTSAYSNETSPLKSLLFVICMTYANRVSDQVWADKTGENRMTRDEYAAEVESAISERLNGHLDGLTTIIPTVYFTAADIAAGGRAHVDLEAQGGVMFTSFSTTIRVTRREEDEDS